MVVWCSQGSCTGGIWFLVVGSTDQKRVHFTAKQVFMRQKKCCNGADNLFKKFRMCPCRGYDHLFLEKSASRLALFQSRDPYLGGGYLALHSCYKFRSTMMHMDMMNNDSEHKLFNSESLPTIQYYQHFGYV